MRGAFSAGISICFTSTLLKRAMDMALDVWYEVC
jgi:hypothetical protein